MKVCQIKWHIRKHLNQASVDGHAFKIVWRRVYYVVEWINEDVDGLLLSGNSLIVPPVNAQ